MSFRYSHFCPIARAGEVLGHRWNLLLLRELFLGPQRFSDLRRRLAGVSSSVLAERLRELEAQGVVAPRTLPPPAASAVYELTDDGRAFWPAFREIVRWGARFLVRDGYREGDHVEPDWVRLAAECFANSAPTPHHRITLHALGGGTAPDSVFCVTGGEGGTRVQPGDGPAEASLRGSPLTLLGALAGAFDPTAPGAPPDLEVGGDPAAARALPDLFDMDFGPNHAPSPPDDALAAPSHPKGTP